MQSSQAERDARMSQSTRTQFVRYLVERRALTPDDAARVLDETRQFREAMAGVALRHHLVDPLRIDELLSIDARDFGAAAVERGFLTAGQVEQIEFVHALREVVEVGEIVLMEGMLDASALTQELAGFLSGRFEHATMSPGSERRRSGCRSRSAS
ncbi:MAG: hypothetical protein CHACPFDD_03897 [Phycisphaerae bacterium]|nr:hypothetical protein [Phycisphaerae bacterium]